MPSTHSLSRYGLPLLAVLLAHGLALAWLGRGLPPPPPAPSLLPVTLLGPAGVAPADGVAAVAEAPRSLAPAAEAVPSAAVAAPVAAAASIPAAPAMAAPASAAAPGAPLQAPPAEAVPAAALGAATAAPGSGLPAAAPAPADVGARLVPGTPEPPYPDAARRFREEGSVTLQLRVAADGRLLAVKVLRSSGSPRLDRAARDAAWRWRVLPAERDGRPVDGLLEKTLHFRLED